MIRTLVLEDEPPALARLVGALEGHPAGVSISGSAGSLSEARAWLLEHPPPDLIVADIQLSDGLSFELFERIDLRCPVIFCTAFDEYLLEALAENGIDYLLKPISTERVHRAVDKYVALKAHFTGEVRHLLRDLKGTRPRYRRRLLVKRRAEYLAVPVADIAYITTEHKLSVLVLTDGERFVMDRAIGDLADELDPAEFFRANRQYLVRIDAVTSFTPVGKGRLELLLEPRPGREVVVSQENAGRFRAWVDQ